MTDEAIEIDGPPTHQVLMQAVQSSAINSYGYARSDQSLYVLYRSGGLYRYKGVTAGEVAELTAADSKGSYMVTIRNRHAADIIDTIRWRVVTPKQTEAKKPLAALAWGNIQRRDCWV